LFFSQNYSFITTSKNRGKRGQAIKKKWFWAFVECDWPEGRVLRSIAIEWQMALHEAIHFFFIA
jgi:hypothetical protein